MCTTGKQQSSYQEVWLTMCQTGPVVIRICRDIGLFSDILREASPPPKKNLNVNFFQIGPLPPRNVNFLKSIFDFLLIRQKIDLIKCKLWGRPPPPFWEKFTF